MEFMPRTDFLFPATNMIIGLGSILNIAGCYSRFNTSASEVDADQRALASDWALVAEDLRGAMAQQDAATAKAQQLELAL